MSTALLIDLDVIAYRAAFATEKTKYVATQGTVINNGPATFVEYFEDAKAANEWAKPRDGAQVWSRKDVQPEDQALLITDVMLRDIYDHYKAENPTCVGYLTGIGNYRHAIATRANYKSGRGVPPVHLKAVRKHLIEKHGAIVSAGEEADDMLGIAMTADKSAVCVSIDKDLKQLPGRHYDFVKREEVTVSAKEASINFYAQILSGDPTDNIPGLVGVGPVKARKALADCRNVAQCWVRCLSMYCDEFAESHGRQYAIESASLVYVRRLVGEMWTPPDEAKAKAA